MLFWLVFVSADGQAKSTEQSKATLLTVHIHAAEDFKPNSNQKKI